MESLWLMTLYTIIAFILQAIVVAVIYLIEGMLGSWSGVVFITAYFVMFWAAWPIALRLTEPKEETAARAQRALRA